MDVERAARNLQRVKVVKPDELSVYDVLRYDALLIPEQELSRLQEVWS
jgi:ribosomal protein L4